MKPAQPAKHLLCEGPRAARAFHADGSQSLTATTASLQGFLEWPREESNLRTQIRSSWLHPGGPRVTEIKPLLDTRFGCVRAVAFSATLGTSGGPAVAPPSSNAQASALERISSVLAAASGLAGRTAAAREGTIGVTTAYTRFSAASVRSLLGRPVVRTDVRLSVRVRSHA